MYAMGIKFFTTKNGMETRPVLKSVKANTASRMYDGVLRDRFLQINARIRAFPTTATGDKIATIIETTKVVAPKEKLKVE